MKFTNQDSQLEVIKEIAITGMIVTASVGCVLMLPKCLKMMDVAISVKATEGSLNAANAVRNLSLAKNYDLKAAEKMMLALPQMIIK